MSEHVPEELTGKERAQRLLMLLIGVVLIVLFWNKLRTVALFVIMLGVLIYVHELGHFLAARWAGVRVFEFALGFGPRLWTYLRRNGTDFTVRSLPLGGFVSMKGMDPEEEPSEDGLNGKSRLQRAVVYLAGPLMNLVLAVVLLCSVGFVIGTEDNTKALVGQVTKASEAERMGLQVGDQIIEFNGQPIVDQRDLVQKINGSAKQRVVLTVLRAGRRLRLTGTPQPVEVDGKTVGRLGFVPLPGVGPRQDLATSVREGLRDVGRFFVLLGHMVRHNTLGENVGGPVAIGQAVDHVSRMPAFYFIHQMAVLSLSLFVFNLLPIPILDGGHLLLLSIEAIRRRRLRPEALRLAQAVGLVVIGTLFILVLYKDIVRLLS